MANNANSTPATEKKDLVSEIGTLTYPRAVQNFGKEKAIEVMRKVAEIGGHGMFEDVHFMSPLFGGLAMPHPDKIAKPEKAQFAHLPEGEFYFQSAMEEYEGFRQRAIADRAAINDFYLGVK
jgi:hypothetical protein